MPRKRSWALALALAASLGSAFAQAKPDALKLYRDGLYDEARAVCLQELSADPSNLESYVVLGWSLLALGRYADAELYARKAWDTIRRDPRIVQVLGEAAFHQGKNEEALAHFQNYVNFLPDGTRLGTVYFYMGEIYLRMERWAHADIAFRTALQYDPGNARWWTRLGYARERSRDWAFALQAYDEALKADPALADARLGRERAQAALRD